MSDHSELERRAYKRYQLKEPVELRVNEASDVSGSLSGDISEGGIRLKLFKFLPVNSSVSLSVQLIPQKIVEYHGRVVWVEENPMSEMYEAGVAFNPGLQDEWSRKETRLFFKKQQGS